MFAKLLLLLSFIAILTIACGNQADLKEATAISAAIKTIHAPDKRVALWDIQLKENGNKVVLTGQTNLPTAKADLLKQLTTKNIAVIDSIDGLPA